MDTETPIEFIKRKFVTADNTIIFDEQFEGYLKTLFNKLQNETNKIRHLVVYDNLDKKYYTMNTAWTNEEVESIGLYNSKIKRWKVFSEHGTEEEATTQSIVNNFQNKEE